MYQSILHIFPNECREMFWMVAGREKKVNEIRLRCEKPILVMEGTKEWYLKKNGEYTGSIGEAVLMDGELLERIIQHICHYSLYAYEEEIRQGYITIAGGHRVGLVGQVVLENNTNIRTIKHIRGVNIRVAHQIKGVCYPVLSNLYREGRFRSTLIVSAPGCGKTTILRDLIRCISDGNEFGKGETVGVVDERSEIAGSYLGQPQNDVGIRTDVLDACPKAMGMMLLLRAMSPKVIAIDELGSEEEIEAVKTVANCGCKILATMHGSSLADIGSREGMQELFRQKTFEMILLLARVEEKCVVSRIYERGEAGEFRCIE